MRIKAIVAIVLMIVICNGIDAQNTLGKSDDLGRIALNAYVSPQVEAIPLSVKNMLSNKLRQVASKNGMGGSGIYKRFIITPNVTVLSKDFTSTVPPMTSLNLEITIFIGDGIEGNLFSSTSIELKGVGTNETKAYINAIKNINPSHPQLQNVVRKGKERIIEYYNSNCDFIIKEAKTLAGVKKYDAAILRLAGIPTVCKECYDKCMDELITIYSNKMEYDCKASLTKAEAAIAMNDWKAAAFMLKDFTPEISCYEEVKEMLVKIQDHQCAEAIGKARGAWANRDAVLASKYLSMVPSDSKCYPEAKELFESISAKLDENEKRDWDLAYEKYNRDQELREREMTYKETKGVELKKKQIQASKEIGIAFGKNQPDIEYNISGWLN